MTGHLDIELECLKKFADFKIISVAPLADSNSFLVNLSNRGLDATCIVRVIEKNDKYSLKYTFKTLCDNLGIDINLSENYNDYRPYKIYMDNLLLPKIKKKYNKRKKHNKCDDYNSDIKHITGFNSKGDYVLMDSDKYDLCDDVFQFLPYDEDITLESAYANLKAFLTNYPSLIPVFLYAILAFAESFIDDTFCPDSNNTKNPIYSPNFKCYDMGAYKYFDYYMPFSLWLHSDNYTNTKKAANLFCNMFIVNNLKSIYNNYNLHINIALKRFYINDYNSFFKDIPILVYSTLNLKYCTTAKVQTIINNRWNYNLKFSPVFVAQNGCRNRNVLDMSIENIDIPSDMKSSVNYIYRSFICYLSSIIREQSQNINRPENAGFIFNEQMAHLLYRKEDIHSLFVEVYHKIEEKFPKNNKNSETPTEESSEAPKKVKKSLVDFYSHRWAYLYKILSAAYAFNAFLISNNIIDKSDHTWLNYSTDTILSLIIPKKQKKQAEQNSHEADINALITFLKEQLKLHINDSPQETVWFEKHKITAGNTCQVYSFNTQIVRDFIKYELNTNALQMNKLLFEKEYIFKSDNRFCFDKNANGKKYRVYKFNENIFNE